MNALVGKVTWHLLFDWFKKALLRDCCLVSWVIVQLTRQRIIACLKKKASGPTGFFNLNINGN